MRHKLPFAATVRDVPAADHLLRQHRAAAIKRRMSPALVSNSTSPVSQITSGAADCANSPRPCARRHALEMDLDFVLSVPLIDITATKQVVEAPDTVPPITVSLDHEPVLSCFVSMAVILRQEVNQQFAVFDIVPPETHRE